MTPINIVISRHASMQMERRRISTEDVALVLQFGDHRDGVEEGTREACNEVDGKPITVVYDSASHEQRDMYYIVTALRRRC